MAVIQSSVLKFMAFSPTSSSSFAPQIYTDSPPLDKQILVCGKTRATILPRENFITKYTHKHFWVSSFGQKWAGIGIGFWCKQKIDWKFTMSIKFVKRAKNALFTLKFKLAIQKKTFRSKSTILVFNLRRNAKVTVPISLVTFRQNLEFLNFTNLQKSIKINFILF